MFKSYFSRDIKGMMLYIFHDGLLILAHPSGFSRAAPFKKVSSPISCSTLGAKSSLTHSLLTISASLGQSKPPKMSIRKGAAFISIDEELVWFCLPKIVKCPRVESYPVPCE